MSVQNLFQKNDYTIYSNRLNVDNLVVDELTIDNGVQSVDLIVNNSNALVVTGGNIYAEGIQFNTDGNQSVLNKYSVSLVDNVIPLIHNSLQVGELICEFEKVGSTVFCEVRGFIDFPVGTAVASVAIPTYFRPVHEISIMIPFYLSAATPDFVVAFGVIDVNGIITIYTSAPLAAAGVYNTGITTGPSNYDRYTFCYRQ